MTVDERNVHLKQPPNPPKYRAASCSSSRASGNTNTAQADPRSTTRRRNFTHYRVGVLCFESCHPVCLPLRKTCFQFSSSRLPPRYPFPQVDVDGVGCHCPEPLRHSPATAVYVPHIGLIWPSCEHTLSRNTLFSRNTTEQPVRNPR